MAQNDGGEARQRDPATQRARRSSAALQLCRRERTIASANVVVPARLLDTGSGEDRLFSLRQEGRRGLKTVDNNETVDLRQKPGAN